MPYEILELGKMNPLMPAMRLHGEKVSSFKFRTGAEVSNVLELET
jgi:hypothetical protein